MGNTHYLFVRRPLVYHLLPLSTPTRVRLEGSRTNLVIGDRLPQIFKDPGNLFMVLNTVFKLPQLTFDARELAGRNLTPSLKGE